MSNERQETRSDALVTDVYRELADERTPRHLDDRVLRMAARERRTRYSLMRGWLRPMAWAATIGLSLAIVMELTMFSNVQPDYAAPAPAAAESMRDSSQPAKAPPATPDPVTRTGLRQEAPAAAPPQDKVEELVPQTVPIVEEAEELARLRSAPDREAERSAQEQAAGVVASSSFAAKAVRDEAIVIDGCSTRARESADTWFACIEELREQGHEELADGEYEAFMREFPDYEPATSDR